MPVKKRQGKSEKHEGYKNSNIKGKSKGTHPKTGESRPSCVKVVLVLLLLVLLSAGVFVYFVDVNSVIDSSASQKSPYTIHRKADITNGADNKIRRKLDDGDVLIEKRKDKEAVSHFQSLVKRYPQSPRANFGLAEALWIQAEVEQTNTHLENSITQYLKILDLPDVPKALMLKAGRACVSRQDFRGWSNKAVNVLKRLADMYPEEIELWNEIGVQNMMVGRSADARLAFDEVLRHDPENPNALAHVGYIIKNTDKDPERAIPYLLKALSSGSEIVKEGRFFNDLSDALQRTGNITEAHYWYEKGTELGIFRSKWQRSVYNVDHLDSSPWWTHEQTKQTKLIQTLEENWQLIRDEGLANMDRRGMFKLEDEDLSDTGEWKQLPLFQKGRKNVENCKRTPKTCALIEKFPEAAGCKRGQVKYSIMQPGVHVWPHCGPTNCRIRAHLGLVIPDNCCRIRVAEDIRTWQEGKVIIFDDSFEHEVWHEGDSFRLVLIIDIWHPDLTQREKATLGPI